MYGVNSYGVKKYADDSTGNSEEEYYSDLFPLVPPFISEKKEMHALYDTQGYAVGYLVHCMEDMMKQCFIATATWGLTRWEKFFGLPTNLSLTYEQRREILYAKIQGQGTVTVELIKTVAAAFSGGDVEVIEDNPNHCFTVRFVGIKGIPRNMSGFIAMLESIKPAHLAYRFEYRYTVWNDVAPMKWNEVQAMSWEEIRIFKEV